MSEQTHAPTPWLRDSEHENRIEDVDGYTVTWVSGAEASINIANARHIIRAVNSHKELLAAAHQAAQQMAVFGRDGEFKTTIDLLLKAIAKAEARP